MDLQMLDGKILVDLDWESNSTECVVFVICEVGDE